mmetsp:Transcript_13526/g.38709  ORF Transcript_13526/g.38709 Transcript_13526/m.38709 type:complete len:237 (-) Transcript_13526:213-923(-)
MGAALVGQKELPLVGTGTGIGHRQDAWSTVAEPVIELVFERSSPQTLLLLRLAGRLPALHHEILDAPVEDRSVVLPGFDQTQKVGRRPGRNVGMDLQIEDALGRREADESLLLPTFHHAEPRAQYFLGRRLPQFVDAGNLHGRAGQRRRRPARRHGRPEQVGGVDLPVAVSCCCCCCRRSTLLLSPNKLLSYSPVTQIPPTMSSPPSPMAICPVSGDALPTSSRTRRASSWVWTLT